MILNAQVVIYLASNSAKSQRCRLFGTAPNLNFTFLLTSRKEFPDRKIFMDSFSRPRSNIGQEWKPTSGHYSPKRMGVRRTNSKTKCFRKHCSGTHLFSPG